MKKAISHPACPWIRTHSRSCLCRSHSPGSGPGHCRCPAAGWRPRVAGRAASSPPCWAASPQSRRPRRRGGSRWRERRGCTTPPPPPSRSQPDQSLGLGSAAACTNQDSVISSPGGGGGGYEMGFFQLLHGRRKPWYSKVKRRERISISSQRKSLCFLVCLNFYN